MGSHPQSPVHPTVRPAKPSYCVQGHPGIPGDHCPPSWIRRFPDLSGSATCRTSCTPQGYRLTHPQPEIAGTWNAMNEQAADGLPRRVSQPENHRSEDRCNPGWLWTLMVQRSRRISPVPCSNTYGSTSPNDPVRADSSRSNSRSGTTATRRSPGPEGHDSTEQQTGASAIYRGLGLPGRQLTLCSLTYSPSSMSGTSLLPVSSSRGTRRSYSAQGRFTGPAYERYLMRQDRLGCRVGRRL